jgi:hypothetical protein
VLVTGRIGSRHPTPDDGTPLEISSARRPLPGIKGMQSSKRTP